MCDYMAMCSGRVTHLYHTLMWHNMKVKVDYEDLFNMISMFNMIWLQRLVKASNRDKSSVRVMTQKERESKKFHFEKNSLVNYDLI